MTNFWDALTQIDSQVADLAREYRLYYDVNGDPVCYSMEDLDGEYIIIDQETYAEGRYDVRVEQGKLIQPNKMTYKKLVPSDDGTETTIYDMSIVGPGRYWLIKYSE